VLFVGGLGLVQQEQRLFMQLARSQFASDQPHSPTLCLPSGYTDITMTGDGISDRVLQEVALKAGPKVTRVRVAGSSVVTDAGLVALLAQSKSLETLELEDLSKTITGNVVAQENRPKSNPSFGISS
jgi:hypothetical protein